MSCKVTQCAGCVSANTRPHQLFLYCGNKSLYCDNVSLYCGNMSLYCDNMFPMLRQCLHNYCDNVYILWQYDKIWFDFFSPRLIVVHHNIDTLCMLMYTT